MCLKVTYLSVDRTLVLFIWFIIPMTGKSSTCSQFDNRLVFFTLISSLLSPCLDLTNSSFYSLLTTSLLSVSLLHPFPPHPLPLLPIATNLSQVWLSLLCSSLAFCPASLPQHLLISLFLWLLSLPLACRPTLVLVIFSSSPK